MSATRSLHRNLLCLATKRRLHSDGDGSGLEDRLPKAVASDVVQLGLLLYMPEITPSGRFVFVIVAGWQSICLPGAVSKLLGRRPKFGVEYLQYCRVLTT